jgi:hypothetical protein
VPNLGTFSVGKEVKPSGLREFLLRGLVQGLHVSSVGSVPRIPVYDWCIICYGTVREGAVYPL